MRISSNEIKRQKKIFKKIIFEIDGFENLKVDILKMMNCNYKNCYE